MDLPSPFTWQDEHIAIELPGTHALFTTRRGGRSGGPYASLNLGRWTDDEPAAVRANRATVEAIAGAPFAFGRQIHGAEVHVSREPTTSEPAAADGQLTDRSGIAPMVLTADCLPVAVAGGGAVAMLHGGWRGLAGGVIARGVEALQQLVGRQAPLQAAIGPGAGPCCYEVSEEVHMAFADQGDGALNGFHLDLKAVAARQLQRAGVATVHDVALCTICSDPSLFFSHRRDRGITGRQAGVAWLS